MDAAVYCKKSALNSVVFRTLSYLNHYQISICADIERGSMQKKKAAGPLGFAA